MAVARALTASVGLESLSAPELARLAGRGNRSALGVHGFLHGGFLVEAGKRSMQELSPLVARVSFPDEWRILLVLPSAQRGLHGALETEAFERLHGQHLDLRATEALCRLVLLEMLPALAERDLDAFGEAVYDFNVRVGAGFAAVQGGIYAHAAVAELVTWLRQQGLRGVGQSSWGPAVFALVGDPEQAESWSRRIQRQFGLDEAHIYSTAACNHGASIEK
jgi:beta-RFAP synthase